MHLKIILNNKNTTKFFNKNPVTSKPSRIAHYYKPSIQELRQEDSCEFKASLGYMAISCLKEINKGMEDNGQ